MDTSSPVSLDNTALVVVQTNSDNIGTGGTDIVT